MALFTPHDPTPEYVGDDEYLDALRAQASEVARTHATVTRDDPRWQRLAVLKAERIRAQQARSTARTDRYGR